MDYSQLLLYIRYVVNIYNIVEVVYVGEGNPLHDPPSGTCGFSDEYHQVPMQTNVLLENFNLYDGTTAQHIHQLNVTSLKHVSKHIGTIRGDGMEVANTYLFFHILNSKHCSVQKKQRSGSLSLAQ